MNMRFQYLKVNVFIVALFGLAVLTSAPTVQAQETTVNIEGSWLFTVTPPAGVHPAFHALVSFSAGGVFFADTQNDLLPPVASSQHGSSAPDHFCRHRRAEANSRCERGGLRQDFQHQRARGVLCSAKGPAQSMMIQSIHRLVYSFLRHRRNTASAITATKIVPSPTIT
jgi:hypothetical protein